MLRFLYFLFLNEVLTVSRQKKKRLFFVSQQFYWTVQKWESALISNKSTVQQFAVQKRHVRRSKFQTSMQSKMAENQPFSAKALVIEIKKALMKKPAPSTVHPWLKVCPAILLP